MSPKTANAAAVTVVSTRRTRMDQRDSASKSSCSTHAGRVRPSMRSVTPSTKQRQEVGAGPHTATTGSDAQLLSEAQWTWLEARLREPAELRIIGTSIPFLQEGTGWETWANFPDEKERMVDLIRGNRRKRHAFYHRRHTLGTVLQTHGQDAPYALWEVNSSGLNRKLGDHPARREPLRGCLLLRQLRTHHGGLERERP